MIDVSKIVVGEDDYRLKQLIDRKPEAFDFLGGEKQAQYINDKRAVDNFKKTGSLPRTGDHKRNMEAIDRYVRDGIEPDAESMLSPEQRTKMEEGFREYEEKILRAVNERDTLGQKEKERAERNRNIDIDNRYKGKNILRSTVDNYRYAARQKSRTMFQKMVSVFKQMGSGTLQGDFDTKKKSFEEWQSKDEEVLRKGSNLKYEFTDEEHPDAKGCFRIRAKKDIPMYGIKKGDLGGFVSKYGSDDPLSSRGNCWVGGDAIVNHGSQIKGDALVDENAVVTGNNFVSGECRVTGNAIVNDGCVLTDSALVGGDATVHRSILSENVTVADNAFVSDAVCCMNAAVLDNAHVTMGSYICDNAIVRDRASVASYAVTNEAVIEGRSRVSEISTISGSSLVTGDVDVDCCRAYSSIIDKDMDGKFVKNLGNNEGLKEISEDTVKAIDQVAELDNKNLGRYFNIDYAPRKDCAEMAKFVHKIREEIKDSSPKEMSMLEKLKMKKRMERDVDREAKLK